MWCLPGTSTRASTLQSTPPAGRGYPGSQVCAALSLSGQSYALVVVLTLPLYESVGSAGTAVVTLDSAGLWTDGRYFAQAEKQLENSWTLMRMGHPDTPEIENYLLQTLPPGSKVGKIIYCRHLDWRLEGGLLEADDLRRCRPGPVPAGGLGEALRSLWTEARTDRHTQ